MNANELKIESLQLEDCIRDSIEREKWKNELSIMRISMFISIFLVFVFSPMYLFLTPHISRKSAFEGYLLLFIINIVVIGYYAVAYKILSGNKDLLNTFRIVNITMECSVISCVFYLVYLIYNGLTVLSGPIFLMFVVIILLSLFRLSFGCEIYSGILCAIFYLLECLYIIHKDGGTYPEIYEYTLISGTGLWCKIIFFITIGIICGALSKRALALIRQIAIKNYETLHVRLVFGKYVSPEIRDYILKSKEAKDDGINEDYGVILFCDINNFSEILEKYEHKIVISQLNTFFENMENIISKNGGVINKFVGSCIMAVFGLGKSEESNSGNCEAAVRTAKEMKEMTDSMNDLWKMNNSAVFDIGIGVSLGKFITGNIGCESRKEFTCLGDVVNVASRLQNKTRSVESAHVLVTADVFDMLEKHSAKNGFGNPELVLLKGKSNPIKVYSL